MSYIDGFSHELVGYFAGRPVYHPLEDIPGPDEGPAGEDFACSTGQLVIGGGTGEHPGLVVLRPAGAVATFVARSGDFEDVDDGADALCDAFCDPILHFAGWSVADYHRFYEACTSRALLNPFDAAGALSFEEWLAAGIGEFVYYAMPGLAADAVEAARPLHRERAHVRYNNILLAPPGAPLYASGGSAFEARLRRPPAQGR